MTGQSVNVHHLIAAKFPAPEYACLFEVRNGTGFNRAPRTADALVMSLWPSRGLELWGIEIKNDRYDWVREKANPEKAEAIAQYCDRWWLAVGDKDIVKPGELPPTWGLMAPKAGKLQVVKEADKLEAKPIDRLFLGALLRNSSQVGTALAVEAERKRLTEQHEQSKSADLKHAQQRVRELQKAIDDFQDASGVKINSWDRGEIGAAVKLIMNGGLPGIETQIRRMHEQLGKLVQELPA